MKKKTRLERLMEDRDIAVIEAIISHLRARLQPVPTAEIAYVIKRSEAQVYGLIKKGREFLELTTGEFIPNIPKRPNRSRHGYTVTRENRAAMYESAKCFDRADGHAAQGVRIHRRIPQAEIQTTEDCQLWLANNTRANAAVFFLKESEGSKTIANRLPNNRRLTEAAHSDSVTPWETLGLENHRAPIDDDSDDIE